MPITIPYPGGKGRLARTIVSFLPKRGRTFVEPFVGRGNIFWNVASQGLEYRDWWLNDVVTFRFFHAIKQMGHRLKVPTRSRTEYERQREASRVGDLTSILLEPYLSFSGGGYFTAGCKGGTGRDKNYGGVSAAGYENAIHQCHDIMRKTQPRITKLDWRKMGLESLAEEDVVFVDPPYPNSNVRSYTENTVDYDELVETLLRARFRWMMCGYLHPLLCRLGEPFWAKDVKLLCVRGEEEGRTECLWSNFRVRAKSQALPSTFRSKLRNLADAASLSFADLDAKVDERLQTVVNDLNALLPYFLEMHRRLSAPGKRTDLRRGAPADLTWTAWVESKRKRLGRSLRTIQHLLRGKTEASQSRLALAQRRAELRYEPDSTISINKVHCGDCIELMDKLQAGSVGLIVTSPPYNLLKSTGNGMKDGLGGKWENSQLANGYDSHDDAMPHEEYVKWQRECLSSMMRVLREDGAIFYNHKWRVQDGLLQDRADIVKGFPVRQIIIWQRSGGLNFNSGYFLPTYEVIYLICKPEFQLAPRANAIGDVWQIPQESENPHPAPFPLELARRCIESTTAEIILDPFMGSGSTAIAAESCGRSWIGIEISREYCKLANDRIKAARRLRQTDSATVSLSEDSPDPKELLQ
jgi:site-specific DNA-methyltransferase (adenine-specific)